MSIRRTDFLYLAAGIGLAAIGVMVAVNPNARVSLYVLAGVLGVLLAVAIILKPVLGANVLIIAIFTNISDLLTKQGGPSVIKPLAILVAGAILVHYATTRQLPAGRSKTSTIELFIFLYFIIMAASYLVARDKDVASAAILDFAKDIVIIYSIQFALRESGEWKQAVWVIMGVTAALCTLELYQSLTGNYSQMFFGLASTRQDQVVGQSTASRLGGPINAPNMWGQVLVAVVPFALYRVFYDKSKLAKLVALLFLGLMLFVIFNTYSRGAYLALGIVLFLIVLDLRVNPMLAIGAVAIMVIAILVLPGEYTARFETLTSLSPTAENGIYQDSSIRGRSSEMLTGLAMFEQHPLLGLGAANYKPSYQQYAQLIGIETRAEPRDAHSLYIQVLAETGILGFVAFMGLMISLLGALSAARKDVKDNPAFASWLPWLTASRLSIVAYLTTSIFLHNAYIRYFWILAAMAITAIQLTQQMVVNDLPRRIKSGSSLS
ncbi:MAG: O-antigen ligase family protein [Bacteroidota bacterium]